MKDTILQNSAIANSLIDKANAIKNAQLEECIFQLSKARKSISNSEAFEYFSEIFGNSLSKGEFAYFCKRLNDAELLQQPAYSDMLTGSLVSFVSNSYADASLDKMCKGSSVLREEVSDFKTSCEAVYYERCDYCLLPLCSASDGYFTSFFKLLRAYELKILRTCTITDQNDNEMRFALLGRSIEPHNSACHLTIGFGPRPTLPSSLISSLSAIGLDVSFVYTSPAEYAMEMSEFIMEFTLPHQVLAAAICYVQGADPTATIVGIY